MNNLYKKKSRRNLCYGLLLLGIVWTLCIYYIRNFAEIVGRVNMYEYQRSHFKQLNVTACISVQDISSVQELKYIVATTNCSETKQAATDKLFEILSNTVQDEIAALQRQDCSKTNIVCGHQEYCGLGCQIHHRTACLIISYALGVAMIHDEKENWPHSDKWSSAFVPLGSQCKIGQLTYKLKWAEPYPILYAINGNGNQLEYPLKDGIPVTREIADIVELIHDNPFLWWIGQFTKFVMQRTRSMEMSIETQKKSINFTRPIVGMQIRRTDKIWESNYIPVERYFTAAEEFFNSTSTRSGRKVFAASDDISLLNEVFSSYSSNNWDIIGFKNRKMYKTQYERTSTLFEIVTDLFLLAESDFVVCTFSSNICRLLLEMRSYIYPTNGTKYLTSLDDAYAYILLKTNLTEAIVKK